MISILRTNRIGRLLLIVTILASCITTAQAARAWKPMLDGLRQRGFYDTALVYLEQMKADPNAPEAIKEVLDYEIGITLLTGSESLDRDPEETLDEAGAHFETFLAAHPHHPLAGKVRSHLANILLRRGRVLTEVTRQSELSQEKRAALLTEARAYYEKALPIYREAEKAANAELKKLGKPTSPELQEQVSQLQTDLLEAKLMGATCLFETAMTYPAEDEKRQKGLRNSAKEFESIYERYQGFLAGLYARLGQGRCLKESGDQKRAVELFESLLLLPGDSPVMSRLKQQAYQALIETLASPEVKRFADAAQWYQQWADSAQPTERSSPEGLQIEFEGGIACLQAAAILTKKDPKSQADRKRFLNTARRALLEVARTPGSYQEAARAKLADPLLGMDFEESEAADFASILKQGKLSLDRLTTMQKRLVFDRSLTAEQRDALNRQIADLRTEAFAHLHDALRRADSKTPIDQLNDARYYLAYLYLKDEQLPQAAVLGDFLVTHYPDHPQAKEAAAVALAAYADLTGESESPASKEIFNRKMIETAKRITAQWPEGPEAASAWTILIRSALMDHRLDRAREFLAKIPADSANRGNAELLLGRELWAETLRAMRKEKAGRPDEAKLSAMTAEAKKLLSDGIQRNVDANRIDPFLFASIVALAQIQLREGQTDQVIPWLENSTYGLLPLIKQAHPATANRAYRIEALKTALRAYIAHQDFAKAETTMDLLEKAILEPGADGQKQLNQIYVTLGRELEKILESLRTQGKPEELDRVTQAFEQFLDRIAGRSENASFQSLMWVGSTFFQMATTVEAQNRAAPLTQKYFAKAAGAFEAILARAKTDPAFLPNPNAGLAIRIRLAECFRRLKKYPEAMRLLVEVLRKRVALVDAQIEAAKTYEGWGSTPGNERRYLNAILGGQQIKKKDGSTTKLVWGWGKLSKLLARSPHNGDKFHQARFHLAYCRYRYAMTQTGPTREENLRRAHQDIEIIRRLHPDLGGSQWAARYNALDRKIKASQKKKSP